MAEIKMCIVLFLFYSTLFDLHLLNELNTSKRTRRSYYDSIQTKWVYIKKKNETRRDKLLKYYLYHMGKYIVYAYMYMFNMLENWLMTDSREVLIFVLVFIVWHVKLTIVFTYIRSHGQINFSFIVLFFIFRINIEFVLFIK